MVDHIALINGLPGSGKTTLAVGLAKALPAPLISKDAIKEAVAEVVTAAPSRILGGAAGEMMWTLAAAMSGIVLLESWWFKPRDLAFVQAGLRRCGTLSVVEVWCDVPHQLARGRYAARRRHQIHEDERQLAESWPRWAAEAEPLGVGQTLRVRTDRPVDFTGLAREVTARLT